MYIHKYIYIYVYIYTYIYCYPYGSQTSIYIIRYMYRSTCIDTDMNGLIPVFLCVLGSDWFPPFRDHTDAISFIYRFRCIFMYIDTVMDGLVSFFCFRIRLVLTTAKRRK